MRTVCGLDVHKDSVFACIVSAQGEKKEKKYDVLTPCLEELRDDLLSAGVCSVAMESTCIYWLPILRVLKPHFDIWVANPLFIKQMPGRKSDQRDAEWIAELLLNNYIKKSFIPDEITQELRLYERRYVDLRRKILRVITQMDGQLQRCNIRIGNYVTNLKRSKSYEKVVALILTGETSADKLLACIHGRTRNKYGAQTIRAALSGVMRGSDLHVLRQMGQEKEFIAKQMEECVGYMEELANAYFHQAYELLQTIPGVKQIGALSILAEIGTDMSCFETASKLVGWAGLKPRNDESAGKIKSRKTTKGNKYLRVTLTQAAWSASRTHNTRFQRKYASLTGRKVNEKKALIAIARKILIVVWHILSKNEPYDPNRHLEKPRRA